MDSWVLAQDWEQIPEKDRSLTNAPQEVLTTGAPVAAKHPQHSPRQMLGLVAADELSRDFLVQLLSEEEADRMVGWNWGVSL